ncbi:hypothetical protein DL96DRAFT_1619605 [Flagelloscypha sp. PMI_526]|nr:hypothetical protein DL96DRAFT_1619605 [Flagelloscypha sp. PMI_526]
MFSPPIWELRLLLGFLHSLAFVGVLSYAVAATQFEAPAMLPNMYYMAEEWIRPYISDKTIRVAFAINLATHLVETGYTSILVWKHVASPMVGVFYILLTIPFGKPIWEDLKRRAVQLEKTE